MGQALQIKYQMMGLGSSLVEALQTSYANQILLILTKRFVVAGVIELAILLPTAIGWRAVVFLDLIQALVSLEKHAVLLCYLREISYQI